jgi:prevent-host-death family protein
MNNFISISEARSQLPTLINKISNNLERVTITVNGQPKATLISTEELESIMETAGILSVPGAKKELREGLNQAKKGQGIPLSEL